MKISNAIIEKNYYMPLIYNPNFRKESPERTPLPSSFLQTICFYNKILIRTKVQYHKLTFNTDKSSKMHKKAQNGRPLVVAASTSIISAPGTIGTTWCEDGASAAIRPPR